MGGVVTSRARASDTTNPDNTYQKLSTPSGNRNLLVQALTLGKVRGNRRANGILVAQHLHHLYNHVTALYPENTHYQHHLNPLTAHR